ncbi:MAG: cell division protein WhiA [Gaiellaceae bacterium]|nr:cell division protein WhiA [Gaiellaceae bacterium]MDX6477624.1 cell division protein WhiA [Gaiellaceae bacterium]
MSLSEELRAELAGVEPTRDCDRLAELSGLFHTAGSEHLLGRGAVALHLDLPTAGVARRGFSLLSHFGIVSEIRSYRRPAFQRETRYQLHVAGDARALQVLNEAGVLSAALAPLERPPKRVVGRACCRSAYLRGALLGGGSLSGPRAPHLEIRSASPDGAEFAAEVAAAAGAHLRVLERARHTIAYAKGAEAIADVLAAAGAADAVLLLEERAVMGATRARANRLANADHANLVRTSRAAHVQLQAAKKLDLKGLPRAVQEAAELRLENPTASLRELAGQADPPTTKAAMHRRLRKLVELAEESALN